MNLIFKARTNKDYCMINTAVFHLVNGGTITIDRKQTRFSITDGVLEMEWEEIYLWAVNGENIFDSSYYPLYPDEKAMRNLIKFAQVEFELEDDADEDYIVDNIRWNFEGSPVYDSWDKEEEDCRRNSFQILHRTKKGAYYES
jgi:hypothetical protein